MIARLIAVLAFAACAANVFADEPKLANATKVFPTSQPVYKRPNQYHAFAMRLSPDGRHVLYTRPVAGTEPSDVDDRSVRYEIVLRELDGGKETVVPVEPLDAGWQSVPTRFNMFDPAGRRLLLPHVKVERRQIDEHTSAATATVEWSIFNVIRGETADTTLEGGMMGPAKFTADGHAVLLTRTIGSREMVTEVISLGQFKTLPKPLRAPGWVQSVSPADDVAVFFVPPARPVHDPAQPDRPAERPPARLVLWDLKADQELAEIPTHPRNGELDDRETQWTANGRYLYYVDVEEVPAEGEADRRTLRSVTRIWDRQAGKPAGTVSDALPVGPGPGQLMVLAKRRAGGFLLHDAASGKEFPLGDASKKLIHAYGAKVVYAQEGDDSEAEDVLVADIIVPAAIE
jgi:hypothetical protein